MKIADVKIGQKYLVRSSTFRMIDKQLGEEVRKRMAAGEDPEGEMFSLYYVPGVLRGSRDEVKPVRVTETGLPYGKKRRPTGVRIEADFDAVIAHQTGEDLDEVKRKTTEIMESIRKGLIGDDEAIEALVDDLPETHTEPRVFECVIDARSLIDPIDYEAERFRFRVKYWDWSQQDESTRPSFESLLDGE